MRSETDTPITDDQLRIYVDFGSHADIRAMAAELLRRRTTATPLSGPERALPPFCDGCGCEIDPDACGCGAPMTSYAHDNHSPIEMGCNCLRVSHNDAAIAKGLRDRLRAVTASMASPRTVTRAELRALSEQLVPYVTNIYAEGLVRSLLGHLGIPTQPAPTERAAGDTSNTKGGGK